jgi:hypothetical protein
LPGRDHTHTPLRCMHLTAAVHPGHLIYLIIGSCLARRPFSLFLRRASVCLVHPNSPGMALGDFVAELEARAVDSPVISFEHSHVRNVKGHAFGEHSLYRYVCVFM